MRNQIAALASNYTVANRPSDLGIRYIIIHATQLSYDDTVARFLAPNEVSAHVVIRQTDGLVTEMVASQNVACMPVIGTSTAVLLELNRRPMSTAQSVLRR
ncbi:hypothetical protein [Secundilactobacillus odoratitofui]|uniref:hypothetical protein n=1 Tax=Secundilactobacillus odoratitofui TaxID=480930 RepID=UPI0006CF6683|nr:hypothetical protein [Secundilactobacillus odoratitofui]